MLNDKILFYRFKIFYESSIWKKENISAPEWMYMIFNIVNVMFKLLKINYVHLF